MTILTTRAGKGSPLTNNEMDQNLNNLNDYKVEKTSGTGSARLPSGTTAQRDVSPQKGWTRYNSTLDILEYWNGTIWVADISSNNPVFTGTLTTDSIINISAPTGVIQVGGIDVFRFGSDNSGQLAGFRNILINGDMRINQRGVSIAAAATGAYGPDRWKKVDASNMTQIVEAGNFEPSTVYTLSGTGVTTQQITSPASGNWTLPNIPITATKLQLEKGSIATPFEKRPIGLELSLCQRYYYKITSTGVNQRIGLAQMYSTTHGVFITNHPVPMRSPPTVVANGLVMGSAAGTGVVMNIFSSTSSAEQLSATITGASTSFVAGNACLVTFSAAGSFIFCDAEL